MALGNEAGEPEVQQPAQQNMFEGANGSNSDQTEQSQSTRPPSGNGLPSLERLRDRVALAINELNRLRTENARLKKRVDSLQQQAPMAVDGTAVVFSESADELKIQLKKYIDVIDDMLADKNSTDSAD